MALTGALVVYIAQLLREVPPEIQIEVFNLAYQFAQQDEALAEADRDEAARILYEKQFAFEEAKGYSLVW